MIPEREIKEGQLAALKALERILLREVERKKADESWYCDPCAVEVYDRRCPHCGKTKRERT